MRNILVPYDGSPSAQHAIQYVAKRCAAEPAQVHVLNVQDLPVMMDFSITPQVYADIEREIRAAGEKTALQAGTLLGAAAVPHQLHVHVGLIADTIAQQAESLGCEEIVMGTRGLGTLSGLVLGSVASKVVHLAKVPVTLVK